MAAKQREAGQRDHSWAYQLAHAKNAVAEAEETIVYILGRIAAHRGPCIVHDDYPEDRRYTTALRHAMDTLDQAQERVRELRAIIRHLNAQQETRHQ